MLWGSLPLSFDFLYRRGLFVPTAYESAAWGLMIPGFLLVGGYTLLGTLNEANRRLLQLLVLRG